MTHKIERVEKQTPPTREMSVSKADVCTLYVDGVTKPWKQDPLELKDGTPIQGGTQLPFSSTKEGRQELKTFLNDLNPLWQWNYRGGSSYFPGTRVIRHDYLRCHFAGEVRKKGGKFAVRTKRCGCEAGFNIVWTTAGALHCVRLCGQPSFLVARWTPPP